MRSIGKAFGKKQGIMDEPDDGHGDYGDKYKRSARHWHKKENWLEYKNTTFFFFLLLQLSNNTRNFPKGGWKIINDFHFDFGTNHVLSY